MPPPAAAARDRLQIAVIGAAACDEEVAALAYEVGAEIAAAEGVLICGGRGGVMEAASRGARDGGGLAIGILPGTDAKTSPPNRHLSVAIFSGMGQARNQVLVLSAHAVVAVGGGWGTLSEIAMALKYRVPVVLLESWKLKRPDGLADPLMKRATSPAEAVAIAARLARRRLDGRG